jgi:hypothetical protein
MSSTNRMAAVCLLLAVGCGDGERGAVGAEGQPGPVGADGPAGPRGAEGPAGPAGVAGPASGVAGPLGDAGPAGDAGPVGDQGPVGEVGPAGASGGDDLGDHTATTDIDMANNAINNAAEVYVDSYFRATAAGGITWDLYGGGWNMEDATYLRTSGAKPILATGGIAGYGNTSFPAVFNGASPRIYANFDNAVGGGIQVSDEGGFFDFNDGWVAYRGVNGLRVTSDNTSTVFEGDMKGSSGSGPSDKVVGTSQDGWGRVGLSGRAWHQAWSYNFNTVSDERLKKDIVDLDEEMLRGYLDRLDHVRSVTFRYVGETKDLDEADPTHHRPTPHLGVIAQSMPEETVVDEGEVMGVSLMDTIGFAYAVIRGLRLEAKEKDADLRQQVEQCHARADALEASLN